MRQLRINFFLMHIKPNCTGSSCSTNLFPSSKGQSKKMERNISCCASSKLLEILCYTNGSGEKLKETWPDSQLLELLSNSKFSAAPQNCCESHASANYTNWPKCIAQPLAHTESFLMMDFCLLCCPAHLPVSPRLANISVLSSVSWGNLYSRLWVILVFFLIWFADSKGEICWWAPNMWRSSAFAVHGKMLPDILFQEKLTPLNRDLVLTPLAKSLGFKSFLATSKFVTFSISCSALASSWFSLKIWLFLLSHPWPLFKWGVLYGGQGRSRGTVPDVITFMHRDIQLCWV